MLENQMESDKMIEISEADFPEIPEIAALEREIFPDAWSLKSLEETWKQKNAAIFVAKTKEGMAGYLIFYYVLEEGEIARIATAHSVRRQGAASQMFRKLLDFCREQKITRIMLDGKCGFTKDGIRRNYYENPKENAVLMSVNL